MTVLVKPTAAPIALPTRKTSPTLDTTTAKILLYGPPKIGKTTLAASVDPERTLFIATEPGLGAQSVFAVDVATWSEFMQVVQQLRTTRHQFTTVVIDTVDGLHKFCTDAMMRKLGITHPSDLEYGKGWGAVTDEFQLRVATLTAQGLGCWFISHATEKEVKIQGRQVTRIFPTLGGGARTWLTKFCDFILYAEAITTETGEERVLRTTAGENYEAGGRVPLPDPLPLDAGALNEALQAAAVPVEKKLAGGVVGGSDIPAPIEEFPQPAFEQVISSEGLIDPAYATELYDAMAALRPSVATVRGWLTEAGVPNADAVPLQSKDDRSAVCSALTPGQADALGLVLTRAEQETKEAA